MLFSIIMPVYNSEKYLNEAINSITNQTIGFEEAVELIIIDDGSTDQSEEICKAYKDKYPNNIKYIKLRNSGPAKARNEGLANLATDSKYVGFLDSDDKLQVNALEKVYDFFQQSSYACDLVTIPFHYFEGKTGKHRLNYRFKKGTREIDILKEPEAAHFFIGGTFFKKHSLEGHRFNEELRSWEDTLFINEILLKTQRYGVISDTKYFYRKRTDTTSLVDTAWYRKDRYTPHLKRSYFQLINLSLQEYERVLPYVQFLIAYHIKLYILQENNNHIFSALDDQERQEFFNTFVDILQYLDVEIILQQNMRTYYKEILLSLKYKGFTQSYNRFEARPVAGDIHFYCQEHFVGKLTDKKIKIRDEKVRGLYLELTGDFNNSLYDLKEEDKIFIFLKGKKHYLEKFPVNKRIIIWNKVIRDFSHSGFKVRVPIYAQSVQFGLEIKGHTVLLEELDCRQILKDKLATTLNLSKAKPKDD